MNIAAAAPLIRYTSLSLIAVFSLLSPANAQISQKPATTSPQPINPNNPNVLSPTTQNNSLLSIEGGQRLMQESDAAFAAQKYDVAAKKLQEARQVFNQLSNFYQDLNSSFSGIDNRVSDSQRKRALETAQLRDETTYRLALVHRALNQPELAVPLLVQIIKSQNPTRDLGKKAYQQLFELGFVDVTYPQPEATSSAPTPPATQNNSLLSIEGGQRLLKESDDAVSAQKYDVAAKKLLEARQVFNQLSNFYQDLNSSFSGIDNRVSDSQRKRALETAQLRDETTYRLALVHRALNQPELAVPLLVQIIKSQNPTRDLGKKAYQQLFELGFVNAPYPRQSGRSSSSSSQK
jgi:sorbitol-specific phosphotransferase system component IIA